MERNYGRRTVLGAIGSVAIAGCTDDDSGFWDDAPSFDDAGLAAVTESSIPDRPEPLPIAVADDRIDAVAARVDEILSLVPDDLDAETLPNGAIRTAIVDARSSARSALDRMRSDDYALEIVSAGIEACASAAKAAGVLIHVSVNLTASALPVSPTSTRTQARDLQESLPGGAAAPQEGLVFYARLEDWLMEYAAQPETAQFSMENTPLESGDDAHRLEESRATVAAAADLYERYQSSLQDPVATADAFDAAIETLAEPTYERFQSYYGGEVPTEIRTQPVDEYVSRSLASRHPGRWLLDDRMRSYFWYGRFWPMAWPERAASDRHLQGMEEYPAFALRRTHGAFTRLESFARIRNRLERGEDFVPRNADEIASARSSAISAVSDLAESGAPLDQWTAWELVPRLQAMDEQLASDRGRRDYARTYAEYVWIGTVGRTASDATERIAGAFDD